jgi:GrpB-like predicted nucleotidyltransferase (UPF0157 family)
VSDGVRVVEYDPRWPGLAAAEIERVRGALGAAAVGVEHIGSTAVPGLAAKPIIDLLVSVAALDESYVAPLQDLGYLFSRFEDSPERHFFGRPHERPRTHHAHVVVAGGAEERRHIAFRDLLRTDPDVAAEYAAVKRAAAAAHPDDLFAYMDRKDPFIRRVQARL